MRFDIRLHVGNVMKFSASRPVLSDSLEYVGRETIVEGAAKHATIRQMSNVASVVDSVPTNTAVSSVKLVEAGTGSQGAFCTAVAAWSVSDRRQTPVR